MSDNFNEYSQALEVDFEEFYKEIPNLLDNQGLDLSSDSTQWEYIDLNEWECLVSHCSNLKDYIRILMYFSDDGVFNEGRKQIIMNYSKCVAQKNPSISHEITFILEMFIKKFKKDSFCFLM